MARSALSTESYYTAQKSARSQSVGGVVLHHGATTSADAIISMETTGSRQVSSHQVVKDNRRASLVEEEFRAWSLSDAGWDSWALTVECANESTDGWTISDASHESLAQLVADWSRRYGFYPHRNGDPTTWTVIGHREVYTIHGGSYATACPGGMDLDRITRRAQQILGGGTSTQGEEMPHLLLRQSTGHHYLAFANTSLTNSNNPDQTNLMIYTFWPGQSASAVERGLNDTDFKTALAELGLDSLIAVPDGKTWQVPKATITDAQADAIAAKIKLAPPDLTPLVSAIAALDKQSDEYQADLKALLAKGLTGTVTLKP